jgi:hypothetical protein
MKKSLILIFISVSFLQIHAQQTIGNHNGGTLTFTGTSPTAILSTNRSYFLFDKEVRTTNGWFGSNSGNLSLRTAGTTRMTILNSTGFVGINFTNPQHHLHIHGTTTFTEPDIHIVGGGTLPGIAHGISSRISLTNSTTGSGVTNGGLIFQAQNDLNIKNYAPGNLILSGGGSGIRFAANRGWMNEGTSSQTFFASMNYKSTTDNGVRVHVTSPGKYGILSIAGAEEAAYLATTDHNVAPANINFKVTGGGEVYARKYTTTLATFPDYVFESDYNLLPLAELRNFISDNGRLPNMPSAQEILIK